MKTLIENIRIISPDEILLGHGIIIDGEKIIGIELLDDIDRLAIDSFIDGKNLYISPGFIDIHNHGNSGRDIMDSTKESLRAISDFHLKHGVTSFLGTVITSSYENMKKAIKNIVEYDCGDFSSKLLGIHLEGPFFAVEKKGAQPNKYIRNMDLSFIKEVMDISDGKLKMLSLAPELEGSEEIIDYLANSGVKLAMAHSNGKYKDIERAIDSGVTIATHLYNGMREFNHREPGIIGAALNDERVYCEIIYDRIHVHDIAVELAFKLKGADRLMLVSDSMRATGLDDGIYELGGQTVIVKDKVARLENNTLAGSLLTLDKAVYNMIHYLNIDLVEAVKMASLTPARAIDVDRSKGSIEVGKDADLIFIDEDIKIHNIILRGNVICPER